MVDVFLKEVACCFSVTNNFLFFSIFYQYPEQAAFAMRLVTYIGILGVPGSVIESFYTILVSKVIFI